MATPDTSTLTSSAQIFSTYTLPQIRAVHKTLHTQIDEKSARLRTQVGNSYRQLLGTADTIVQMREDIGSAQDVLGHMGTQCGRAAIDNKVMGLGRFRGNEDAEAELSQVARVKLLRACGLSVSRLLKKGTGKDAEGGRGDRLVLAAKVFVLSRLLVSSFGDLKMSRKEIRGAVEAAKKSLDGLRRKLVRAVEKVLQRTGDGTELTIIIKALSAYSLSSSSGTKDVLHRFLSIRAEAITYEFGHGEDEKPRTINNVLRGLELYTRTIVDVQALIPNKLPEALLELKKKPLLADESLRSLEGLRLDIFEGWCGDDIRYFTPFIRHDDLEGEQARDMLTKWATKGSEIILDGLGGTLQHISEFKAIVELRTSTLRQWIRHGGKAKGFDPSIMLNGLRKAINDHLLQLIETKVVRLKLVGSEVTATLEAWESGVTDRQRGLWDDEMLGMDFSIGAAQVTHEVVSRVYGRNEAVARAVTGFESWHHIIDNVGDLVEQLRRQRWDNDEDEIEDEAAIETRQELLSKDDPQMLHTRLDETLVSAFANLDNQLTTLWQDRKDASDNGPISMYILRTVRDIRRRLPKLEGIQAFGLGNVSSLHEKLAAHVSVLSLEEFTQTLAQKRVTGRALWEGEPALPTQPSPSTFRLLRNITMSMGDAGVDLWTPAAVKTLKHIFSQRLVDLWRKELAASVSSSQEVESVSESEKEKKGETDQNDIEGDKAEEGKTDEDKADDDKVDENKADDDKVNENKADESNTDGDKTDGDGTDEIDGHKTDNTNETTPQNSDDEKKAGKETTERSQDIFIQWLFDVHVLRYYLHVDNNDTGETLKDLASEVLEKTGLDDEAERRVLKVSQEYFKRTSLLFGLLA